MIFNQASLLWQLSLCIWLGSSIAHCEQSLPNKGDGFGARVDKLVQDRMYHELLPGLALVVLKDGKILLEQGYGLADLDSKLPVTTNTVFRIGSLSKPFVATAIMMLVEEGKISLDEPVSKYLDGTPGRWKGITIRHLLTHTSGIPDFNNENLPVAGGPGDFDQRVLKAVSRRWLHFAPGDEWRYRNSNYHLLGMIIHKITGKPYDDFLRERIFEPLGMTRTTVIPENGIYPGLASGYTWNNAFHRVAAPIGITAGGSILSSISDMAKWDAALCTDTLLKKASLQQMWAPVRLNDGMTWRYGFGWVVDRVNDRLIASHTGNIIGFSSAIERNVDDRLTVILLDNRFDSQPVAGKLAYNIARLYCWTGPQYQPIPDKETKITDRVRGINDRFDHGKLNAADFTPLMWSELSPWRKQAEQDGKTLGPALSLALVERSTEAGRRSYRYRVSYKS